MIPRLRDDTSSGATMTPGNGQMSEFNRKADVCVQVRGKATCCCATTKRAAKGAPMRRVVRQGVGVFTPCVRWRRLRCGAHRWPEGYSSAEMQQ